MIRNFSPLDLDEVMEIWLMSNLETHDFIDDNYWKENTEYVRRMLPRAQIYVFEEKGIIKGFIGLNNTYIEGIFVDRKWRGKGVGKALLDQVKTFSKELVLSVYEKNLRAKAFYLREGFEMSERKVDEATGETEIDMVWKRNFHE